MTLVKTSSYHCHLIHSKPKEVTKVAESYSQGKQSCSCNQGLSDLAATKLLVNISSVYNLVMSAVQWHEIQDPLCHGAH